VLIFTRNLLGSTLGDFFTNSSGHPDPYVDAAGTYVQVVNSLSIISVIGLGNVLTFGEKIAPFLYN
jgi:hypothetical protein